MRKLSCRLLEWAMLISIVFMTGCTEDVFVDRLKVSNHKISLSEGGEERIVKFSTDGWKIYSIGSSEWQQADIAVWFGNKNEKLTSHALSDLQDLYTYQPDRVVIRGEINYQIERDSLNRLRIIAGNNLMEQPSDFKIKVTDGVQYAEVDVRQNSDAPFVLDSVSYKLIPESVNEVRIHRIENMYTNVDTEVYVPVVSDNYNLGRFRCRSYDGYFFLPPMTRVEIPLRISNGKLVMGGGSIPVSSSAHMGKMLITANKKMKLKAGQSNRIIRITAYQYFTAEFKIYVHSVKSGRKTEIEGLFDCIAPLAEDSSAYINND